MQLSIIFSAKINKSLIKSTLTIIINFFAKWAKLYDYVKFFLFPLRWKATKFLQKHLPSSAKRILDVATGTGSQAFEIAKLGYEVVGIDLSPEMLKQAEKKCSPDLKLKFLHADATSLPFSDNSFDSASISFGLHDMPYEIGIAALKEMKRVIKKKGKILIVDYMEPKKHPVAKISNLIISLYETKNYHPFIKRGLDSYLKEVNLRIKDETNFLGIFQIVIAG
ncbi:MAG: hypothetical protein KatS3mg090_0410 [Patescibacteria group bacterium]|nr:MAG: hypothetical protein KatS3mg090_0410 [Patescibacteria group bacterium]